MTAPVEAPLVPVAAGGLLWAEPPAINLMPPSYTVVLETRRMQGVSAAGVLVALALVILGWQLAKSQTADEDRQLAAVQADRSAVVNEVAGYASVSQTYRLADAAEATLGNALGQEIRYSRMLAALAQQTPSSVQLTTVSFTQVLPAAGAGATPSAPSVAAAAGATLGTVGITGYAPDHDTVATWLDRLDGTRGLAGARYTSSADIDQGGRTVEQFESAADLAPEALSGRYVAGRP